jgi:hypothetical protein
MPSSRDDFAGVSISRSALWQQNTSYQASAITEHPAEMYTPWPTRGKPRAPQGLGVTSEHVDEWTALELLEAPCRRDARHGECRAFSWARFTRNQGPLD